MINLYTPEEHKLVELAVEAAMTSLVNDVAAGIGAEHEFVSALGMEAPTEEGLVWTVNQPVSLASVLADLAARLNMAAPVPVRVALGDPWLGQR